MSNQCVIVGRNPSQQIGRNPSPSRVPSFSRPTLGQSTVLDPNGLLVSAVQGNNRQQTVTIAGGTAHVGPADGLTYFWQIRDPAGFVLTSPVLSIAAGFTINGTPPANGTDLVIMAGIARGNAFGSSYIYSGFHYDGANPKMRWGSGGSANNRAEFANLIGAQMTTLFRPETAAPTTQLEQARATGTTSAGDREDNFGLTGLPSTLTQDFYYFMTFFRSTTEAGNVSVTFTPGYTTTVNTASFTP